VYGGRSRTAQFVDIGIFDFATNRWEWFIPIAPVGLMDAFEPVPVFVPRLNGYQIYVYGGISIRSNTPLTTLYRFDSDSLLWTTVTTLGPRPYRGGVGIYHAQTHSLRFAVGYNSISSNGFMFTQEYSINSGTWNIVAQRPGIPLYQAPLVYLDSEVAIVHGGQALDSSTTCFQHHIEVLDLACNQWDRMSSLPMLPRKGHGMVYRNQSIWIFGGTDGLLYNDVVEIPFQPSLANNSSRNLCRGIKNLRSKNLLLKRT
jgi:N-acetylneuraminic acid mutarotase